MAANLSASAPPRRDDSLDIRQETQIEAHNYAVALVHPHGQDKAVVGLVSDNGHDDEGEDHQRKRRTGGISDGTLNASYSPNLGV